MTPYATSLRGFIVPRPRFRERWRPARRREGTALGAPTRQPRPSVPGPRPASSRQMPDCSRPSSTVWHGARQHNRSARGSRWIAPTTLPCASRIRRSIARSTRRTKIRKAMSKLSRTNRRILLRVVVEGGQRRRRRLTRADDRGLQDVAQPRAACDTECPCRAWDMRSYVRIPPVIAGDRCAQ